MQTLLTNWYLGILAALTVQNPTPFPIVTPIRTDQLNHGPVKE